MTVITDKTEQLSQELDRWHKQQSTDCSDQETAELLQLAVLVKQAAGQEAPPPEMVSRTIEQLVANPGRVPAKRRWWQAALAGTAAVLFLIAAQISPQGLERPGSIEQQAQLPAQPPAGENRLAFTPPMTISPLPAEQSEGVIPQVPAVNEAKTTPKAAEPRPAAASVESKPAPVAEVSRSDTVASKQPEPASASKHQWAALVLPGHKADSVLREAGAIRQVYNAGKEDEIVITQQETTAVSPAMRQAPSLSTASSQADTDNTTAKAKVKRNRITMTVKGREVVLEGSKSSEELRQIGGQLTEEKQEEAQPAQ